MSYYHTLANVEKIRYTQRLTILIPDSLIITPSLWTMWWYGGGWGSRWTIGSAGSSLTVDGKACQEEIYTNYISYSRSIHWKLKFSGRL